MSPEFEKFFKWLDDAIHGISDEDRQAFWDCLVEWYWDHEEDKNKILQAMYEILYVKEYDSMSLEESVQLFMEKKMECQTCKTWGKTVEESGQTIIACPDCGRKTWPNLGVNCPAGCAVSFGSASMIRVLKTVEVDKCEVDREEK